MEMYRVVSQTKKGNKRSQKRNTCSRLLLILVGLIC